MLSGNDCIVSQERLFDFGDVAHLEVVTLQSSRNEQLRRHQIYTSGLGERIYWRGPTIHVTPANLGHWWPSMRYPRAPIGRGWGSRMPKIWTPVIVVIVICSGGFAPAQEVASDSVVTVHHRGDVFLVPASPGATGTVLGKGYTRDLRDIDTNGKKFPPIYDSKLTSVPTERFASSWSDVSDDMQFGLSANYFTISGAAKSKSSSRYAVLTVYQIGRVEKLDTSAEIPSTEADLVLTEIWYGWGLNYWFEGQASDGELSASIKLMSVGGDFQSKMAKRKVTSTFVATGLERKSQDEIPIVMSLGDIMKYFSPSKEPQPVLLKYVALRDLESSLLPGARARTDARKCSDDDCLNDAWIERASSAVKAYMTHNANTVATRIQEITHPTGKAAQLSQVKVERSANGITTTIDCVWSGGFIGAKHHTIIRWEVTPGRPLSLSFDKEGAIGIGASNKVQLERYFNSTVFGELAQDLN